MRRIAVLGCSCAGKTTLARELGRAQDVFRPVTWSMLRWMLGFRRRHRPRVLALLARAAPSTRVVVRRSRRDADAFAANVRRRHGEVMGTAPR
jgi:hypothetical protein